MSNNIKSIKSKQKVVKKSIQDLLNQVKTADNTFTHVSLGGHVFHGKFNITSKENIKLLHKLISQGMKYDINLPIAEKPQEYGPIKIDIDLKIPEENYTGGRLYDNDMINDISSSYKETISKYLDVTNNNFTWVLFEKKEPVKKNGEYKDGFHIIFPYLVVEEKVRYLICEDVIKKYEKSDTFASFCNPNPIDKQVVASNPWMMYGCSKPASNPYYISKIYDFEDNEIDIEILGKTTKIVAFLSLYNKRYCKKYMTPMKEGLDSNKIRELYNNISININNTNNIDQMIPHDDDNIIRASKLVDMLAFKRSDNYHDWIRVGWALHNTHKALLSTWIVFSKRSKKFKNGECDRLWNSMRPSGLTIRSLMSWAKDDSPKEYNNYMSEEFNFMIKKNKPDNTFGIATAFYNTYQDRFVCINTSKQLGDWYHFKNNRWFPGNGSLLLILSKDFANKYIGASNEMSTLAMEESGGEKKTLLENAGVYRKVAEKLQDISFKEKILREAKHIFYDKHFMEKLDENPNLIGYENGVYDLEKCEFRLGHPDDHISFTTRLDYIPWSDKNPYKRQIEDFFEKVLVNKNVREYFLKVLSTTVSGFNREEKFYFCTGVGSNGKSLTFALLSKALGDYYLPCPITILTRKRNASNAASPEIIKMKGPRGSVFQEPGMDEELNIGIFKELSGNDEIQCRDLFAGSKEMCIFKPQLTHFMACNDMLEIKGTDNGTWRRVVKIDFASEFLDNPDPNNPFQFKIDETLKEKIDKWAPHFSSYLVHIYTTQYATGAKLVEPEEVRVSTNNYRKDQDVMREYYDNCIEFIEDDAYAILKRDLSANFKMWFRDVHDGEPLPKSKKLYEFIEKELKQTYKPKGYGKIRFKKLKEDSDSEEEEVNPLDL